MSYEILHAEPERGLEPLSGLLGSLSGALIARARATGSAYALWAQATGAREHNHTMGVYLAEPDDENNRAHKRTLTVYVDSSAILQDFRTNANLYLMKLERVGLKLDAIEFRLSRKIRQAQDSSKTYKSPSDVRPASHPERTPEQVAELEARLESVENPALRESLRRAIGLTPHE